VSERDDNRAAFPMTAAMLDQFRAVFGADTRVVHAQENGREIGRPTPGTWIDWKHPPPLPPRRRR
jgi:hypothetical protein